MCVYQRKRESDQPGYLSGTEARADFQCRISSFPVARPIICIRLRFRHWFNLDSKRIQQHNNENNNSRFHSVRPAAVSYFFTCMWRVALPMAINLLIQLLYGCCFVSARHWNLLRYTTGVWHIRIIHSQSVDVVVCVWLIYFISDTVNETDKYSRFKFFNK